MTEPKYIVGMEQRSCALRVAEDTEDNRESLIVICSGFSSIHDASNARDEEQARVDLAMRESHDVFTE